ncbi:MAG TPA: PAS domain S-box protein [Candidatus Udaeobacter sp.]|nr:PAS domain S-box protein [Candidatus Udaeobacter sp.]
MKRSLQKPGGVAHRRRLDSAVRKSAVKSPSSEQSAQKSQIFDIAQDAIFFWRKPGGIEFWNRGATELYGYTEKEALGRISHELLRTRFPVPWSEIEAELQSHGSWKGELRHRTRDGQEVIVLSRFQIISRPGEAMLILESTRDITEAKRSEEQLQRRLREQAIAARFSLDALQATNIQTICDDATYVLHRELGVDFSGVFEVSQDGKTLFLRSGAGWKPGHIGHAKIDASEETAVGRALQLNQPIVIEDVQTDRQLRLPQFMNDHKIASSMAVVIQGRSRAFGVVSVDTTSLRAFGADEIHFLESIGNILATAISRIQFEHDLHGTAARLKAIVDTAVDGIITINERGIIETINAAAERIFGYRADEVMGRNVSMLMPEPYRSEHDGYIERYRRTGERRIIGIGREVRGRRKDGTEFPMDLAVSASNLGDRRIFTGLVRDISARKRLEQEVLEATDQEKRRLGSDLHDDLCQRLAGIRFACDALKKTLAKSGDSEAADRIAKIGVDVGDTIDRTRMLARGMAPVAFETNGLASALQELAHSVQQMFTVNCTFCSNEPVSISDPGVAMHLYRIAQESLNNSLKHAKASEVMVSLEMRDDRAVLTIEDNGVGFSISEANGARQGMGLRTIAYRAGIIDADLQVQSAPGKGTKVICTFSSEL